jgi:signal transduction histidine kinase
MTEPTRDPALLLVDDRPENLQALEAALAPLGRRMIFAASGEEALKQLLVDDVAVIVLDVQMPGIDGFETAEAIKRRERTRDIPIVFLTAISREQEHQLRGYETGAVDYIAKPVDPELLRARVKVFTELRLKAREIEEQRAQLAHKSAELARSNADLEQFAYTASHDVQEPLRVISGYLELLAERLDGSLDDESRQWIDRSRKAAERASLLVRSLLVYARAGAGEPVARAVPLGDAVTSALEHLSPLVDETGATVTVAQDLPTVVAEEVQLMQVVQNLVANSLSHRGDTPPHVSVSAASDGRTVTVSVVDDGPGVPEDAHERVFGLFERVEGGPYPGSAIGLAICRKIVERHGGRIWLEPVQPHGTAVRFTLRAAP